MLKVKWWSQDWQIFLGSVQSLGTTVWYEVSPPAPAVCSCFIRAADRSALTHLPPPHTPPAMIELFGKLWIHKVCHCQIFSIWGLSESLWGVNCLIRNNLTFKGPVCQMEGDISNYVSLVYNHQKIRIVVYMLPQNETFISTPRPLSPPCCTTVFLQ